MTKVDLKMRILSKFFYLIVLTVGSAGSGLASTFNVPCNYLSISNALAIANEGDIVFIQPGSCIFSNFYTINRNVSFTIRGSGMNTTTIISTGIGSIGFLWWRNSSTNVYTISDINFVGSAGDSGGMVATGDNPPCTPMAGRGHFYNLQMTNVLSRGIFLGYGDSFGLIDHCYFVMPLGAGGFNPVAFAGNDYYSWLNSNPLGTLNVCCVEDCTFLNNSGNIGNGFFDCYNGSQAVLRHCIFDGTAANGAHGYDSQPTAMRTLELYNNVFTNQNSSSASISVSRGGVFECFSNTIWISGGTATVQTVAPTLEYYRGANGSYQSSLGYAGYALTNFYSGTASSGTANTLTDTNNNGATLGTIRYFNEHVGKLLKIVSGTGAGQSSTITANTVTSFTISGTFSPAPDNTSGYELWPQAGYALQVGNQPRYVWQTSTTATNNISRYVLIGSTLAACLTNLMSCVNVDPAGAGVLYAAATTNTVSGKQKDLLALRVFTSPTVYITFTNILDGTNAYGWPAAMQSGVMNVVQYTNIGVVLYPCYSAANVAHNSDGSTTQVNFGRNFSTDYANGLNYINNLLVAGRDYYQETLPPYTPLIYPHPLQSFEFGGINSANVPPSSLNARPGP
jgi:hypothetical protein